MAQAHAWRYEDWGEITYFDWKPTAERNMKIMQRGL